MNLLKDAWIPVRPQESGAARQISLETLLCGSKHWELALPRDDMELAALQLLVCLVQVILPPADARQWRERIRTPLDVDTLRAAAEPYQKWFQLDHPDFPFMQVRGVKAQEITPMDKLLAGLDSSQSSRFVNERNLASCLCFGCAAIALFNQANNSPSFCGGVKAGLRSSTPTTTFARLPYDGFSLRETIHLNILTQEAIEDNFPASKDYVTEPNWVLKIKQTGVKNGIKQGEAVKINTLSPIRSLFWQPAHIELSVDDSGQQCACCGMGQSKFNGFKFEKFSYEYTGAWAHPHSPQILSVKDGKAHISYVGFNQSVPAWTDLSKYIVDSFIINNKGGAVEIRQAEVIKQIKKFLKGNDNNIELIIGGYRNEKAKILDRRHEVITLGKGWESHTNDVTQVIEHSLKYRDSISKAFYLFSEGIERGGKKIKGASFTYKKNKKTYFTLQEIGINHFYRRSEGRMLSALANIKFDDQLPTYLELDKVLSAISLAVFDELTSPYQHDPELFRTLTIARRSLLKELKEIRYHTTEEEAA